VPFNIPVSLVLPGRAPWTSLGKNAQPRMQDSIPVAYADVTQQVFAEWSQSTIETETLDVAEAAEFHRNANTNREDEVGANG